MTVYFYMQYIHYIKQYAIKYKIYKHNTHNPVVVGDVMLTELHACNTEHCSQVGLELLTCEHWDHYFSDMEYRLLAMLITDLFLNKVNL